MGLSLGGLCGVYLAQNYQVINVIIIIVIGTVSFPSSDSGNKSSFNEKLSDQTSLDILI